MRVGHTNVSLGNHREGSLGFRVDAAMDRPSLAQEDSWCLSNDLIEAGTAKCFMSATVYERPGGMELLQPVELLSVRTDQEVGNNLWLSPLPC